MQAELDGLIDANPKEGTPRHDHMELLAILIGAYEAETLEPFVAVTGSRGGLTSISKEWQGTFIEEDFHCFLLSKVRG